MTLISRILGFSRDVLMASLFGASVGFDAFLVAFKIPNFMRALFAEGAFAQAFVPILTEYQHKHQSDQIKQFLSRIFGLLLTCLLLITFLAEIIMPMLVILFAPGFLKDPVRYTLALMMLRITLPYLPCITLTAFFAAVLNSHRVFAVPAFIPVILNLVLIFAAVFCRGWFHNPEMALPFAVFIAGILQFGFLLPILAKNRLLLMPRLVLRDKGVRRVMSLLLPSLFGVSIVQIGLFINTFFASFLPTGSISWLYYADRLTFFPLGIFGVALSTVVLPYLSAQHTQGQGESFNATLDWAIRCILVISLPAAIGLFILAHPVVEILFKHGLFTERDVLMTTYSVMAFALGIPGFMAVKIFVSAFYARQEVGLPVRIALSAVIIHILLNSLFIFSFKHVALAFATSFATTFNAVALYVYLRKQFIYQPLLGWGKFFLQLFIGNSLMGFLLWQYATADFLLANTGEHSQMLFLLLWIVVAMLIYFIGLWLSGMRLQDFKLKWSTA